MSPYDKAAEEIAKTAGKAIDRIEAVGQAVRAVLGPVAEVWLGGAALTRAQFEHWELQWRLHNAQQFSQRLQQKADDLLIDLSDRRPVPPRVALDYREGIETEDDPTIRELWINLVLNTTRPDGPTPQKAFKDILHRLDGDEARIFALVAYFPFLRAFGFYPQAEQVRDRVELPKDRAILEVDLDRQSRVFPPDFTSDWAAIVEPYLAHHDIFQSSAALGRWPKVVLQIPPAPAEMRVDALCSAGVLFRQQRIWRGDERLPPGHFEDLPDAIERLYNHLMDMETQDTFVVTELGRARPTSRQAGMGRP